MSMFIQSRITTDCLDSLQQLKTSNHWSFHVNLELLVGCHGRAELSAIIQKSGRDFKFPAAHTHTGLLFARSTLQVWRYKYSKCWNGINYHRKRGVKSCQTMLVIMKCWVSLIAARVTFPRGYLKKGIAILAVRILELGSEGIINVLLGSNR